MPLLLSFKWPSRARAVLTGSAGDVGRCAARPSPAPRRAARGAEARRWPWDERPRAWPARDGAYSAQTHQPAYTL